MDGWKRRKKRLRTALGAIGLLVLTASDLRAELLYSAISPEEMAEQRGAATEKPEAIPFMPQGAPRMERISHAREDWQLVVEGLRGDVDALKREVLQTALTMFFIRGGTPPPPPPHPKGNGQGPPGQSGPP